MRNRADGDLYPRNEDWRVRDMGDLLRSFLLLLVGAVLAATLVPIAGAQNEKLSPEIQKLLQDARQNASLLEERIELFLTLNIDHGPYTTYVQTVIAPKYEPQLQALSDDYAAKYRLVETEATEIGLYTKGLPIEQLAIELTTLKQKHGITTDYLKQKSSLEEQINEAYNTEKLAYAAEYYDPITKEVLSQIARIPETTAIEPVLVELDHIAVTTKVKHIPELAEMEAMQKISSNEGAIATVWPGKRADSFLLLPYILLIVAAVGGLVFVWRRYA